MNVKFLEITFSRHGTCKLLCDTSLALARSSPTRRYTGYYVLERNSQRDAVRRKRTRDLLDVCKRFRLHVGKTPIDDAG